MRVCCQTSEHQAARDYHKSCSKPQARRHKSRGSRCFARGKKNRNAKPEPVRIQMLVGSAWSLGSSPIRRARLTTGEFSVKRSEARPASRAPKSSPTQGGRGSATACTTPTSRSAGRPCSFRPVRCNSLRPLRFLACRPGRTGCCAA